MTLLLTLLAGCAVCGPSFSDTCAVEDGACSEPEPSACARASGISLGISHAAVDAALVSTSCQPYYVAACDGDPDHYVRATYGSDGEPRVDVFTVDGASCDASYFTPWHVRADNLQGACFGLEDYVYTGPPELEACTASALAWLRASEAVCDPLRGACDVGACVVDLTR